MARFIILFVVLVLAVLVTAQFLEEEHFNQIARKVELNKMSKAICHSPSVYGKCKGHRQMWYFNRYKTKCENFTYSNCGGNRNRFFTKAECDTFCTERAKLWTQQKNQRQLG